MSGPMEAESCPWLCVLASGSSGNCSVLVWHAGGRRRAALIDLGLSPRRTARLLCGLGLDASDIAGAFLTHLDSDHLHPGWSSPRAPDIRVHAASRHAARGWGVISRLRVEPFELSARMDGLHASCAMGSHDELGVATFRFSFDQVGAGHLGYATDVGRITSDLIDHLTGVDVLALESNYCPKLENGSSRPEFLKRRIMGGSGHLSNEESARAAKAIAPRQHLVLLHLSRECNRPAIALERHNGVGCPVTVSTHMEPTLPIPIRCAEVRCERHAPTIRVGRQAMLFGGGVTA